jgi:hypothetical protein
LTFAANAAARSFRTHATPRARRTLPGTFAITHELVDLRPQRRHEPLELVRVAVRDDDRGDRHASSSR